MHPEVLILIVPTRTYDSFGNVLAEVWPARSDYVKHRAYTYCPDGHKVSEVEDNADGRVTRTFAANGSLLTEGWGDQGPYTTYDYDQVGNLVLVTHGHRMDQPGAHVRTTAYSYDAQGNNLTRVITQVNGDERWAFAYDDLGNLRMSVWTDGSGRVVGRAAFTHDADGRMLTWSKQDAGGAETARWTYSHDAHGRKLTNVLTTRPSGRISSIEAERQTFTYDGEGRLQKAVWDQGDGRVTTRVYSHDAEGRVSVLETRPDGTTEPCLRAWGPDHWPASFAPGALPERRGRPTGRAGEG